jgi:hypothetical protein
MAKKNKQAILKLVTREFAGESLKFLKFRDRGAHGIGAGVARVAGKGALEFFHQCSRTSFFGLIAPLEIFNHYLNFLYVCCDLSIANTGRQRLGNCVSQGAEVKAADRVVPDCASHPLAMWGRPCERTPIKRRAGKVSQGAKRP